MKKFIVAVLAAFFVLSPLLAITLPDGRNVRSYAVTTYKSGALRTVNLGSSNEGVEITTPIGVMRAKGTVCYYEDGSLKSFEAVKGDLDKEITVQTNMGLLSIFGKYSSRCPITFYPSGALWKVESGDSGEIFYEDGKVLPFEKNQVQDCVHFYHWMSMAKSNTPSRPSQSSASYAKFYPKKQGMAVPAVYNDSRNDDYGNKTLFCGSFTFYDSGSAKSAIVKTARVPGCIYFSTKAGKFAGDDLTFYRDGSIRSGIYIQDEKNGTLKTSLGDIYCYNGFDSVKNGHIFGQHKSVELWQDGSIRECLAGEVMLETINGVRVQIPRYGLLRFRKDGSLCAYTTELETEYKIGNYTYTANKTNEGLSFNTVGFDENGIPSQFLDVDLRSYGKIYNVVTKFYPSGAIWKGIGTWYSEDGTRIAYVERYGWLSISNPTYDDYYIKGTFEKNPDEGLVFGAVVPGQVRLVHFGKDGSPESYECYKTVSGIDIFNIDGDHIIETNIKKNIEKAGFNDYMNLKEFNLSTDDFLEVDDDMEFVPEDGRHTLEIIKFKNGY